MLHPFLASFSLRLWKCCCGDKAPPQAAAVLQRVFVSLFQDCLQEIQDFLKKHMDFVFSLLGIAIGFTVTVSVLSHFSPERQDPVRRKIS